MIEVYLLPVSDWRCSLMTACSVLRSAGREACFVDPRLAETESEALAILAARLPIKYFDLTGSPDIRRSLEQRGLSCEVLPAEQFSRRDALTKRFGPPRGTVVADSELPAGYLKAAVLAVKLGYDFRPAGGAAENGQGFDPDLPVLWYGKNNTAARAAAGQVAVSFHRIEDDKDLLNFLRDRGQEPDYLVILNSADLEKETRRGNCLGNLWVRGLSLNALTLAAYRDIFIFDAFSGSPQAEEIEKTVNRMVRDLSFQPRFQAVLASPAVVPFFYEEKRAVGAVTEEMVRDIHVRLNNDLFFDLAEGRLMQNSPGGLSVQLISTRRYREIQNTLPGNGRRVLITATPHVESGIIFSTDEALIDTQLIPLLEDTGCRVRLLKGREAHFHRVAAALADSDYFLFTGHGGPEALHTHGRSLYREDLPFLPPLVAYASACSTVALVPHWHSPTEGLDWIGIPVDSRQVIGLSFVEKGALCYVGGATIEDLQYTTSTYSVFLEALLIKGLSVGEAVREIRHIIALYAATLLQKNPDAYRKYRWGTANAIHQQILLGDPAFTPSPEPRPETALPRQVKKTPAGWRVEVEIPGERWRRSRAPINTADPSKYYYRCRSVEAITPYGEDIFSWGDYYRVAPDARNISEYAVKSTFLHLSADLSPGEIPLKLVLAGAEIGGSECLLCGQEVCVGEAAIEAMQKFRLPYLLQPPIELNMEEGWAFSTELVDGAVRVRWLVPLVLIDEKSRSASFLKRFVFTVETGPGRRICGSVEGAKGRHSYLVSAGMRRLADGKPAVKEPLINTLAAALTDEQGHFTIDIAENYLLTVQQQFPLYELLDDYRPFLRETYDTGKGGRLTAALTPPVKVTLKGFLFDSLTGSPLPDALIRVFRGEPDPVGDPLIEAFAGEAASGDKGEFQIELAPGKYILYAAAVAGEKCYKSKEWPLTLREGEGGSRVFALDQAAVVRGRVVFEGYVPPDPPVVTLKRYPQVEGEGALVKVPVYRDGSYECLVSFQDRFQVVLEEEGWQHIYDHNEERGYRLQPREILERNYRLLPGDEQTEKK